VQEKVRKKQTHSLESDAAVETERPKAQVIDLMEALKNSLKKKGVATRSTAKKSSGARRRA
jgi:non-homologous end joining protein Ku